MHFEIKALLGLEKEPASALTGGTVNGTGSLEMEAQAVGSDTMLARIVKMVAEAQRSRAPIQAVADRISGWFVPLVIATAVVTFIVWSVVGPEPRIGHALLNAIAVLIIACRCALGLPDVRSCRKRSYGVQVGNGCKVPAADNRCDRQLPTQPLKFSAEFQFPETCRRPLGNGYSTIDRLNYSYIVEISN